MKENCGLQGEITAKAIRSDGTIDVMKNHNIVVSDGKTTVANLIGADSANAFDYIGIGLGSDVEAVTNGSLFSEVYGRIDSENTATGSVASFNGSFAISGSAEITEYGLFNASTNGSMLSRASGNTLSLTSGDFLEVTWQITVG